MKISTNQNFNIYSKQTQNNRSTLAFSGATDKVVSEAAEVAGDVGHGIFSVIGRFIRNNITHGTAHKYYNRDFIIAELNNRFGNSFGKYLETIQEFNQVAPPSKVLRYKFDSETNTIIFNKPPFVKNVITGAKDFTVGVLLDTACAVRRGYRNLTGTVPNPDKQGWFSSVLDFRELEKPAKEAYYKLSGAFEEVSKGVNFKNAPKELVKHNIDKAVGSSLGTTCKKVGNYNTKAERALNRLGTGLVSAKFASDDFYNISMLQKNDKKEAEASGKDRFEQDMTRQLLTASGTYIILGAFQGKVNKSIPYTILSMCGITLASEVLTRLMKGKSLTPLTPEQAKMRAEKQEAKRAQKKPKKKAPKKAKKKEEPSKTAFAGSLASKENTYADKEVFNIFTSKANASMKQGKKKFNILKTAGMIMGGLFATSLAFGRLRTKNVLGIDSLIKGVSRKFNSIADSFTTKRLFVKKEDVDGFVEILRTKGFESQGNELATKLNLSDKKIITRGDSSFVQHALKDNADPNALYYDLGYTHDNFRKGLFNVLTYPLTLPFRFMRFCNNFVRTALGVGESKAQPTLIRKNMELAEFTQKYAARYGKAKEAGALEDFNTELQDVFTRQFSEANSKNRNTTVAALIRPFVVGISSYFFVNDCRNEVLIQSKGRDVDRANDVMKEKIGYKVSNLIFNQMLMDAFNTTLEKAYLGSLAGATAVAMATEVTNETLCRVSTCTPRKRMNKDQLIQYENQRLNNEGIQGRYYRWFMNVTGKKPLSEKAKKK